ncbi:MAG: hypothetical protein AAFV46_10730 [Cyanobacteria bacterium J06635_11]
MHSDFQASQPLASPHNPIAKSGPLESEFHQVLSRYGLVPKKRAGWLRRCGQLVLDFFTGTQTLSINKIASKNGPFEWRVYDPMSRTRHVFNSEQAVRTWLEQRYYQ